MEKERREAEVGGSEEETIAKENAGERGTIIKKGKRGKAHKRKHVQGKFRKKAVR